MRHEQKEEIKERMKDIRNILKITQKKFSKELEITPSALSAIESGTNGVSVDVLLSLKEKFNINPNWVLTGEGKPNDSFFETTNIKKIELLNMNNAGDTEEVIIDMRMFNNNNIKYIIENCGFVSYQGSEMKNIKNGDIIIFNKLEKIQEDNLYIINADNRIIVRHVQVDSIRKIFIFKSENNSYSDITYKENELKDIKIIGRVVGVIKSFI